MNDRTAMVVTVVGSSVGMGALLLTVMTLLIGSVNTRIDDLQGTVNTRISDLGVTMNSRMDDTNSRVDDLNDLRDPLILSYEINKTKPFLNRRLALESLQGGAL